jgi:DNA replication protein DnaC
MGKSLAVCPTCGSSRLDVDEDNYGWEEGTYLLDGVEHRCDCQTQLDLFIHYTLANIGDQYQRLNWKDFSGSQAAKDAVALYLDKWEKAKLNGMGLEFSSPNLGVGKTFAATTIAKELIKKGERVYFLPFLEVVEILAHSKDRSPQETRLRDTPVLVLDEVVPAITAAQRELFASKFEEVIRHRTNYNLVTIMTTNLTPDELHDEYPRAYSLLAAKQIRIEMKGQDARQGVRELRNEELLANDEVEPIT